MIHYIKAGFEGMMMIKPLWNKLRDYHKHVSQFFTEDFHMDNFQKRAELISNKEHIQILVAYDDETPVGYLIASVHDQQGEIDSLFIEESYRGQEIGEYMMLETIAWMKSFRPTAIVVSVAYGNQVMPFYEKFGFLPRSVILKSKIAI
ncbi:MAG: GNAT family N-acetyltransferase [Clostridia bacterium]|nr:GNAT family N-acetyltransferase [Clostridia bacterium]